MQNAGDKVMVNGEEFVSTGKRGATEGNKRTGYICEYVCNSILPQHFLISEDGLSAFDLRNSNYHVVDEEV